MTVAKGMVIRITREMKQDILGRNWPIWQYKTWRVGNKVRISSVYPDRVYIDNPRAGSTVFARDLIERAVTK